MEQDDSDAGTTYLVVVNYEEQYSIWPDFKELPSGWRADGKSGSRKECLEYIGQVWTDMRPLSLRRHMDEQAAKHAAAQAAGETRAR